MERKGGIKEVVLYLVLPEDTTEAGGDGLLDRPGLYPRQMWLGPLKTVMWIMVAVAGPLLFRAALG